MRVAHECVECLRVHSVGIVGVAPTIRANPRATLVGFRLKVREVRTGENIWIEDNRRTHGDERTDAKPISETRRIRVRETSVRIVETCDDVRVEISVTIATRRAAADVWRALDSIVSNATG